VRLAITATPKVGIRARRKYVSHQLVLMAAEEIPTIFIPSRSFICFSSTNKDKNFDAKGEKPTTR